MGEYLAAAATSIFLPLEVYDLTVKITWLRVAAFVINLLLVIYLVWARRLFGVRGGKTAYEARLRSESVIEVEQAALAAASPGQPGHGKPASTAVQPEPPGTVPRVGRKYSSSCQGSRLQVRSVSYPGANAPADTMIVLTAVATASQISLPPVGPLACGAPACLPQRRTRRSV